MDSSHIIQAYFPNQPYNVTPAFQPPATILEPAEYDSQTGSMRLELRPFSLNTDEFGNYQFLQRLANLPIEFVSYSSRKYDWDYASRHKAQSILPYLFLGPASVARDANFIEENGISMVIAVRSAQAAMKQPKLLQPSRFPACEGLQTATFDVDNPYEVITGMKPILRSMNDHLESKNQNFHLESLRDVRGKILIFCESGNERSPALVAAYIMLLFGLNWKDAVNFIHAHRFSISLNSSMNDMLRTWEGLLKARFDTAMAARRSIQEMTGDDDVRKNSKRTLDDAYDDMDYEFLVEEDINLRPGTAPFRDTNGSLKDDD